MRSLRALAVSLLATLAGCGGSPSSPGPAPGPTPTPVVGAVMPAFSLPDVNPRSPSGGRAVSPRDHLGGVSAWYFGHST